MRSRITAFLQWDRRTRSPGYCGATLDERSPHATTPAHGDPLVGVARPTWAVRTILASRSHFCTLVCYQDPARARAAAPSLSRHGTIARPPGLASRGRGQRCTPPAANETLSLLALALALRTDAADVRGADDAGRAAAVAQKPGTLAARPLGSGAGPGDQGSPACSGLRLAASGTCTQPTGQFDGSGFR